MKMTLQLDWMGIPLLVSGEYYKGCPERGEHGYSLGTPAETPEFKVHAVILGKLDQKQIEEIAYECLCTCQESD